MRAEHIGNKTSNSAHKPRLDGANMHHRTHLVYNRVLLGWHSPQTPSRFQHGTI